MGIQAAIIKLPSCLTLLTLETYNLCFIASKLLTVADRLHYCKGWYFTVHKEIVKCCSILTKVFCEPWHFSSALNRRIGYFWEGFSECAIGYGPVANNNGHYCKGWLLHRSQWNCKMLLHFDKVFCEPWHFSSALNRRIGYFWEGFSECAIGSGRWQVTMYWTCVYWKCLLDWKLKLFISY